MCLYVVLLKLMLRLEEALAWFAVMVIIEEVIFKIALTVVKEVTSAAKEMGLNFVLA
jgi:hypothetical protein